MRIVTPSSEIYFPIGLSTDERSNILRKLRARHKKAFGAASDDHIECIAKIDVPYFTINRLDSYFGTSTPFHWSGLKENSGESYKYFISGVTRQIL